MLYRSTFQLIDIFPFLIFSSWTRCSNIVWAFSSTVYPRTKHVFQTSVFFICGCGASVVGESVAASLEPRCADDPPFFVSNRVSDVPVESADQTMRLGCSQYLRDFGFLVQPEASFEAPHRRSLFGQKGMDTASLSCQKLCL